MAGILVSTSAGGLTEVNGIGIVTNAPRVTAAGALAAANASVTLAVDGFNAAIVQLTGTWAGTVAWFASLDGGATYFAVNMIPYGGGALTGSATANGQWEFACGGLTHLQAQMTAYTSGSATALLAAANGIKSVRVGAPAGNPVPTADQNGAAFSTATALTAGAAAVAAARSVGIVCTTAGSIVLTLASGGTITLPIYVGWNLYPFAATTYTFSGGGAGSVYNLS